jgi:hypothetical protein
VEATTVKDQSVPREGVSSFAKSLFFGEIHEDLVVPYPLSNDAEQDKVRSLIASVREFAAESIDMAKIEEDGWIGDDVVRGLGERGLCGLYVPEQYGGQGLSQTGYCRVFEAFSQVDASVSVVMGVHQSIGMKGIVMFGSDEQKQRLLPDLASSRKLAAFALTEPEAGSDAYHLQSLRHHRSDPLGWRCRRLRRRPDQARGPSRPAHPATRRAELAHRPGLRPGQAAGRGVREGAAQARQGHHPAPVHPEADRRRGR